MKNGIVKEYIDDTDQRTKRWCLKFALVLFAGIIKKFEFFCRFDEILNNLKLPLVPDTDAYLLYTNAKEFAQLCHSFELNAGDIQKLKTCAEIIVDLYSSVPDLNITPKFHNILHYWPGCSEIWINL
ncbi:hypothetical protein DERP_014392 [Dermatophagoides pteronyssinus]|uniref:Uncharacterized protein n=1 Tax=Dermatophagoides pteronyssinus TaxID=6956 RepID=A0ABQ8J5T0_DERPT|nr:hypothetical protein DERP_014392 [Dermatophagoides pteronyssinus]